MDRGNSKRRYRPQGAQIDVLDSSDRFLVYAGPIRGGKTTCVLFKAHYICSMYPGARVLFLRQTQVSLAQSILVTWENEVCPPSYLKHSDAAKTGRRGYEYKNGSEIVLGGMNKPAKYFSGQYDLIIIFQAEECLMEAILEVYSRLLHYATPFRQMILDVNPREETHPIKVFCDEGKGVMVEASPRDNPLYYNIETHEWTELGLELLESFKHMPAHTVARLRDGKWTNPEGARFADASPHVQGFDYEPGMFPSHWPRWISLDYGKADPYCALWHTRDEEGTIYTYREDYRRGLEADQQAESVRDLSPENEVYEGIWLDGSMLAEGEYARGYGWHPDKGSAAEQYEKVLGDIFVKVPDGRGGLVEVRKFGGFNAGAKNTHEQAYITLDAKVRDGSWKVARQCKSLWKELTGAVYYKDPRTGIMSEFVNPGQSKHCPDHALESAGYGIHKRAPRPIIFKSEQLSVADAEAELMRKRREAYDKTLRPKKRPGWLK